MKTPNTTKICIFAEARSSVQTNVLCVKGHIQDWRPSLPGNLSMDGYLMPLFLSRLLAFLLPPRPVPSLCNIPTKKPSFVFRIWTRTPSDLGSAPFQYICRCFGHLLYLPLVPLLRRLLAGYHRPDR
jgi:hypothetical protein